MVDSTARLGTRTPLTTGHNYHSTLAIRTKDRLKPNFGLSDR